MFKVGQKVICRKYFSNNLSIEEIDSIVITSKETSYYNAEHQKIDIFEDKKEALRLIEDEKTSRLFKLANEYNSLINQIKEMENLYDSENALF